MIAGKNWTKTNKTYDRNSEIMRAQEMSKRKNVFIFQWKKLFLGGSGGCIMEEILVTLCANANATPVPITITGPRPPTRFVQPVTLRNQQNLPPNHSML